MSKYKCMKELLTDILPLLIVSICLGTVSILVAIWKPERWIEYGIAINGFGTFLISTSLLVSLKYNNRKENKEAKA